ncbi:MAG: GspH/FimT family pseudopilin [Verrucomicrobiota bacterium]
MMLPTGKPRSDAGGFTLVELMLVMALLTIVLAVAFPSLKNFFRGRNLDSEAHRFLSLTRYGQSRAVSEGVPMLLWIDAQNGRYGLQTQTGYADNNNDSKAVEFTIDDKLKLEILASQPSPMLRSNLWTQNSATPGTSLAIRFLPDGFIGETSPVNILFRESDNSTISIRQSTNHLKYEIESAQVTPR